MNRTINLFAISLFGLGLTASAIAQSTDEKPAESKPAEHAGSEQRPDDGQLVVKTYFLSNVFEQNDANEVLIAMRNVMDHNDRMYLVTSEKAIVVEAPPDQQALAQKVIADLDRPHKAYRLTFTLADSDNGKRVGVQHFSIVVAPGQRTTLKQGSKIPVITGSYSGGAPSPGVQTQFQYLDIGMNFDVTLTDSPGGLLLKSKVEDTAVGSTSEFRNTSGPLAQEPIIQQTSLEGSSMVNLRKPITLGSIDVPGSTRHIDIEVVAEPIS